MKKNVWIFNHYATNMFNDKAGRHYWFAENLLKMGYNPIIFCANTDHFSNKTISTDGKKFIEKNSGNIPFVFVNTSKYSGNGKKRIFNMIGFFKNLFFASKSIGDTHGKPDVILASSVHPLTLVAGIKIAKKLGIPCICEVRDLWPESLVAYGILRRKSIIAKILYQGEKWIYKNANAIVMTWEGGYQYITDRKWQKSINLSKIVHISNGVVIENFDKNSNDFNFVDNELDDHRFKNIVYAGSIRKVNNLGLLIDSAKIIQEYSKEIRFIVYGSGDEKEKLEERCRNEAITNVLFKGRVEKKVIPSILKRAYANILHNSSTSLDKYGQSQNKFFEYLAAGKCVIQTYTTGYSILEKYGCGVSAPLQTPEVIAELILKVSSDDDKVCEMGRNARSAAYEFDFKNLTNKLIEIIEKV